MQRTGVSRFLCALVETGATSTVIGRDQAEAYCHHMHVRFTLLPSILTVRFGNGSQRSQGRIILHLPHPSRSAFFELQADVVPGALPLLMGLDFMDHYGIYRQTVKNKLRSKRQAARYPIARRVNHFWI